MLRTASEAALRGWATRRGEMGPVERARLRDAVARVQLAAERGRTMRASATPAAPAEKPKFIETTFKRQDGSEYTRKVYTEEHQKAASAEKFTRVADLAEKIKAAEPVLREKASAPELTTEKAAATAALIMRETGMRVGGGEGVGKTGVTETKGMAKETGKAVETFGTTTLERRHVAEEPGAVRLNFVGKAGVEQSIVVRDPATVASVRAFAGIPPPPDPTDRTPLFRDSTGRQLGRQDVSAEIKRIGDFKNKDLRTLVAGEIARREADSVRRLGPVERAAMKPAHVEKAAKEIAKQIATVVSQQLGNTPAVALKDYINPAIIADAYRRAGL